MKKLIALFMLSGCISFTGARIDGLAVYSHTKEQLKTVSLVMKEAQIDQTPEWIYLSSQAQYAINNLKESIISGKDKDILATTENAKQIDVWTDNLRLRAIYTIRNTKITLKSADEEARSRGYGDSAQYNNARKAVVDTLIDTSNMAKIGSHAQVKNAWENLNMALNNLAATIYQSKRALEENK